MNQTSAFDSKTMKNQEKEREKDNEIKVINLSNNK